MTRLERKPDWRYTALVLAGLLLLVLFSYHETVASVLGKWNELQLGEFAHGYLVLAISLYLVYSKRKVLALIEPCEFPLALIAVAACSLLWLVATLVDVQMVQALALLLLLMSVIWVIAGNRAAWQLLFPVLFIGVAIPIWSPLSPLLQDLTADVVFWMTRAAGIPALRVDNLIMLPSGSLSIEEACSGLRYLLAALTLGVLYAWLNYQGAWSRLLVVAIAVLAAIVSNIVRVFVVVYLAYETDMQHPWVSDHLSFGWWLFGGVMLLLLVVDVMLSRHGLAGTDAAAATIVPARPCSQSVFLRTGVLVLTAVLAVSGPVIASLLAQQAGSGEIEVTRLPAGAQGWKGPVATNDDWLPQYHGAIVSKQAYQKGGNSVLLYIGSYPVQTQGSELISDLNRIADEALWKLQYAHGRPVAVGDGAVLEQHMTSIADGRQRLVWYWYRVAGVATPNRYVAKLLQVYGLLTGRPQAALVAVVTDIEAGSEESRQRLRDFILSQDLL